MKQKEQLMIKLRKDGKLWTADTNLCGSPPIGRDENWKSAVGELIWRLQTSDCDEYRETCHLPILEVQGKSKKGEIDEK